ncbi:Tn3 family transposase [Ktedonosporobacter rubrisoli]|uniref:Tn3 family transposase n=1 Tax=Ktedonosporobacter rubrisoli TaxID=2509675 RepID=A0A4P6JJ89_KTERU|nr:Tn3 family transposase [Ktedonosporobacter rubrisoli]QBD75159.1 Tn3 family transposase [Ktedonosporobacter rubrisoli]
MKKHEILSAQSRTALFNPPTDPATIIKYYSLSEDNMALIRKRRRPENRLGFAVHMAYMRYPGRVLGQDETPPEELLGFIAEQLAIAPKVFQRYAQRDETRREHSSELLSYLGMRSFQASDLRALSKAAVTEANGTEKGEAIVAAMLTWLQQKRILLPATAMIERIALAARATARQQAYKSLTAGLDAACKIALEALLIVKEEEKTSPFAWLRQWQEMPKLKNLTGILERLNTVRRLAVAPDREQRIHRARYMAIVREVAIMDAQHLSRQDEARRIASLIVFARETETLLIDAALAMAGKMIGTVFRSAEKSHKEHLSERAKVLKKTSKTLLKLAKSVLAAHDTGGDTDSAIEKDIGWDRLAEVVKAAEAAIQATRDDSLEDVLERHATIRRLAPLLLEHFTFCAATPGDPLLAALEMLRGMYATHRRVAKENLPVAFLQPKWKKLMWAAEVKKKRQVWEVAVMVELRDRLAGSIWVEGSRAFRPFDEYLLPKTVYIEKKEKGDLNLGIPTRFEDWRDQRMEALETRMKTVADLAESGQLPDAVLNEEGLSISPIKRSTPPEAEELSYRLYRMLPRVRITDLLMEVNHWTGFADCFGHLRNGEPPSDMLALMSVLLADATNLGLSRMARSSGELTHAKLVWIAEWYVRDETYKPATALLVDALHAEPLAAFWGSGQISSSDGQFFLSGGRGKDRAGHNAKHGIDPGLLLYGHQSDMFGGFGLQPIAPSIGEAPYVLDAIMHHETTLKIIEHFTDTAGAVDHIFALFHLLGIRFSPRIRDLAERKLYRMPESTHYEVFSPLMGGTVDLRHIEATWEETLHFAASIKAGSCAPSVLLRKLRAYPRQHSLAKAQKEIGKIERSCFTLDWISDPELRKRSHGTLNKGESRHSLARSVFFHRHGEFHDRTLENQRYRASGLNLVVSAIILWNAVYLNRAITELRNSGVIIPDELLPHTSPLGWEHISLNGDYIWPKEPLQAPFRPLRNPNAEWFKRE